MPSLPAWPGAGQALPPLRPLAPHLPQGWLFLLVPGMSWAWASDRAQPPFCRREPCRPAAESWCVRGTATRGPHGRVHAGRTVVCGPGTVSLLTRDQGDQQESCICHHCILFFKLGHFFMIKIKQKPHTGGVREEKRGRIGSRESRGGVRRPKAPAAAVPSGMKGGLLGISASGVPNPPLLVGPDLLSPLQGAVCPPLRTSSRMAALSPAAAASLAHLPTSTFQVVALSLWARGPAESGWCCDHPHDGGYQCSDYSGRG